MLKYIYLYIFNQINKNKNKNYSLLKTIIIKTYINMKKIPIVTGYVRVPIVGSLLNFRLSNDRGSFKIDWIQDETMTGCISITYFKMSSSAQTISLLKIYDNHILSFRQKLLGEYMLENTVS